jgi:hypothetical protein
MDDLLQALDKAEKLMPRHAATFIARSKIFTLLARHDEAIRAIANAIQATNPSSPLHYHEWRPSLTQ